MKTRLATTYALFAATAMAAASGAFAESASGNGTTERPPEKRQFVNDICMPSALYMLSETPNDIFAQPILKRWRPYDDYVRFTTGDETKDKALFSRRLGHVATIGSPEDGNTINVELVNGDEFTTVKKLPVKLKVGKKSTGDNDVYAQIIGDSFTKGTFFRAAMLDSGYVPKLHMVGMRKCDEGQYHEGRGGWSLASYFRVPTSADRSYHGFMQPKDGRYWGDRDFWKMAWRCVRGTQPEGFQPSYDCSQFDSCVTRFDEATGVLLNPQAGDIQFDEAGKSFVRYDGDEWRNISGKSLEWSFDYGKYLKMWKITPPQFLFVSLGLNDFRGRLDADYSDWGKRITAVKDSYLKACPGGRFAIVIPISSCGSIDNAPGDFTPRQNASMWRFRNWLIKTFDGRESEGFHLVDMGIATDNEYGYRLSSAKPFQGYVGAEKLRIQIGNPHPTPNYVSMGIPLAAFIQYYRKR